MSYTPPTERAVGELITASDWNTDVTNDIAYLYAAPPLTSIAETMHPVGALYISTLSTNPATLLGFGTWAPFAAGRTLIGVGTSDQAFAAGATGGASTATLTASYLPPDPPWPLTTASNLLDAGASGTYEIFGSGEAANVQNMTLTGGGGDVPMTVLPPYEVIYMWERTA